MTSLLVSALFYGLAAAGFAALVRKAPWPASWLAKKPLGCAVCMAGWSALLVLVVSYFAHGEQMERVGTFFVAVLLWLASTAVATHLLTQSGIFADPLLDLLTEREETQWETPKSTTTRPSRDTDAR